MTDDIGDVIAYFRDQINELVNNDKKRIDDLTRIAHNYEEYHKEISRVVENRIYEVTLTKQVVVRIYKINSSFFKQF